jgi:hypothetical protein
LAVPIGVAPGAIDAFRARPDQAHLTAQDIEQLGQLGDAQFLKDSFVNGKVDPIARRI